MESLASTFWNSGSFAGSDAPLGAGDMKGMPEILQIPVTAVLSASSTTCRDFPASAQELEREGACRDFLRDIINWQDPAIVRDNPGLTLPHTAIILVHHSDGSGTAQIFTNYLSKVAPIGWANSGMSSPCTGSQESVGRIRWKPLL